MKEFKKVVKYFILETLDDVSNPWSMSIRELYSSFLQKLGYNHFKVSYYKPFRRALLELLEEIDNVQPQDLNESDKNDSSYSESELKTVLKQSGIRLSKEMHGPKKRLVFLEDLPDQKVDDNISSQTTQKNVLKPIFPNSEKDQQNSTSSSSPSSSRPKKSKKAESDTNKTAPKPMLNQEAIDSYNHMLKVYKLSTLPFPRKELSAVGDLDTKKSILCQKLKDAGMTGRPSSSKARELAVKLELKRLEY